jgi:hypothetical protein
MVVVRVLGEGKVVGANEGGWECQGARVGEDFARDQGCVPLYYTGLKDACGRPNIWQCQST